MLSTRFYFELPCTIIKSNKAEEDFFHYLLVAFVVNVFQFGQRGARFAVALIVCRKLKSKSAVKRLILSPFLSSKKSKQGAVLLTLFAGRISGLLRDRPRPTEKAGR